MAGRSMRALGALGAVLVALVLSHSIVYLVRYGSAYGEALAHNGHDLAWTLAVLSAGILGGGLALAGLVQLVRLGRAASAHAGPGVAASVRGGLPSWLWLSGRLAVATAVLLTLQENLERAAIGQPLLGPGLLLSPEFPFGAVIVAGVSLAVGLVVTLFRRRRDALLARIRAVRAWPRAIAEVPQRTTGILRPTISALGAVRGLRAPPLTLRS